jgi:hypothetical protein
MPMIQVSPPTEEVAMPEISSIRKAPVVSPRSSQPRTWAGTLVEPAERATHYLHLVAFPCEKCKGPVVLGWTGKREDDIARETEIKEAGAMCLSCGSRPATTTRIDPLEVHHFRPVDWEWTNDKKSDDMECDGGSLPAELSQDANRP